MKKFKDIVLTEEDIFKMGLTPIKRKKGACLCGKQDGTNRLRMFEVWGTIESKTSNHYAVWSSIRLDESDKVIKKEFRQTWTLPYKYIVDKSEFKTVLNALKKAYKESITK